MARQRETLPKIVAHLQAAIATEVRAGDLAEALGLTPSRLSRAAEPGVQEGLIVRRQEGKATWYSLGDGTPLEVEEDEERPDFNACLWADGDLVIYGHQENVDGSITLTAAQVSQIKRLIAWTPPPA